MNGKFATLATLLALVAVLGGTTPAWPLAIAAAVVAVASIARFLEPGAAGPALLVLALVALLRAALLPRLADHLPRPRIAAALAGGGALIVPPLLASQAIPLQALFIGLAVLARAGRPGRWVGLLALEAVVASAAVGGGPASILGASGLGLCVLATRRLPWVPVQPLVGLLVATLGIALEHSRIASALLLAGAWLAAGVWPLGRWTRGVAGWRFGGVVLAVVQAVALAAASRGTADWRTGATSLAVVGALGVGMSGLAAWLARTPPQRLAADAGVQAALVACAFGIGGPATVYGVLHLLIRAPLLALGTRAPPPATGAVLRWARAGLPLFGTFWTTLAIVMAAGQAQPWLLAPLIPGLLAHVATTWRAADAGRPVAAWVGWLAMVPAAVIGVVCTAGWLPSLLALLPWT